MFAEGQRRTGRRSGRGRLDRAARPAGDRPPAGDLEVIAPRAVDYRGASFADFDAAAAIATDADVVLVDELARMTADATRQRWEDVADVLTPGRTS
jgi:hypothetical protein